MPRTLRNVSCCPANEASGRSSAVRWSARRRSARASPAGELLVGRRGCPPPGRRERLARPPRARISRPTAASAPHVVGVEAGEPDADPLGQAGVAEEALVGVGGGGEPVRARAPRRRQVRDHLAERGVLAADLLQVVQAELGEPPDVVGVVRLRLLDAVRASGGFLPSGLQDRSGLASPRRTWPRSRSTGAGGGPRTSPSARRSS